MHAKSLQSCLPLFGPVDCSSPGSSVRGILQARLLEWIVISFSRGSLQPGIEPASLASPALAGAFFTTSATDDNTHFILQTTKKEETLPFTR